jgi:hypothetical protein
MLGKNKTSFLLYLDRRVDNILRKEAMRKGLSKTAYLRLILNEHIIKEGHNINDLLNQVP